MLKERFHAQYAFCNLVLKGFKYIILVFMKKRSYSLCQCVNEDDNLETDTLMAIGKLNVGFVESG